MPIAQVEGELIDTALGVVLEADLEPSASSLPPSSRLLVAIDHWADLLPVPTHHICVNISGVPQGRRGISPIHHASLSIVDDDFSLVAFGVPVHLYTIG